MAGGISPELHARLEKERLEREAQARLKFASLDVPALLRLRPGMPVDALAGVLGALWTARRPADKGWYFDLSAAGFYARIDKNGAIGEVSFARLPEDCVVEGLHAGMTVEQALAAQPSLALQSSDNKYGFLAYRASLASGHELNARFNKEKIAISVAVRNPSAAYFTGDEWVPAPAGKYPEPAGAPGAPFADANLKLAVLDALLRAKKIDLGTPEELAEHVLGRRVKLDDEGCEPIRPAYDYLARYPLSRAQLDAVATLTFDGGLAIYPYVYFFWDGEGEEFDVRSFAGIESLRNLKELKVISMVADCAGVEAVQEALRRRG